jgi:hypothetical protein
MAKRGGHFSVRPRYTPGSPAQVGEGVALRVYRQELEGYGNYLEGVYGEAARETAAERGLTGVVVYMVEKAKGWNVYDLMTQAWEFWPFKVKCAHCGKTIDCQRGEVEKHEYRSRSGAWYDCPGSHASVRTVLYEPKPKFMEKV